MVEVDGKLQKLKLKIPWTQVFQLIGTLGWDGDGDDDDDGDGDGDDDGDGTGNGSWDGMGWVFTYLKILRG